MEVTSSGWVSLDDLVLPHFAHKLAADVTHVLGYSQRPLLSACHREHAGQGRRRAALDAKAAVRPDPLDQPAVTSAAHLGNTAPSHEV